MPAGGGSVDRAPDSQWTNASSKLERRKYSFITVLILYKLCIGKNNVYVIGKMIHKFCYSHLIMINTLYTMDSTSTSTVHCTIQSVLLFLGSVQFYLGGGGLSPPSPNDAPPLPGCYRSSVHPITKTPIFLHHRVRSHRVREMECLDKIMVC